MDYLHESGVTIYRRRRRRRAIITLTFVVLVLTGTVLYASSYVQGWAGAPAPKAQVNVSCNPDPTLEPREVTLNVYNATGRTGLAATTGTKLERVGFKIERVENDPLGRTILTVGEIRVGPTGAAGAILVSRRLAGFEVVQDGRADATVDVVLGKNFRGLTRPPKVATQKGAAPTPKC
jgi:LytR cell envelope-related transcriptional attenuator